MNTQTHLLVAAAALARPGERKRHAAVIAGALLPDLSIYALFLWSRLAAIPQREVWDTIYWSPGWQTASAVSNSVPLWGLLALAGLTLVRPSREWWWGAASAVGAGLIGFFVAGTPWFFLGLAFVPILVWNYTKFEASIGGPVLLFALAALLHLALDLPVHADDAHRHFWPLTDWRFHSPVSYWNPEHHGRWVSAAEALLGLALCALLWRRFQAWWVRGLLAVCAVAYVAVPVYWLFLSGLG